MVIKQTTLSLTMDPGTARAERINALSALDATKMTSPDGTLLRSWVQCGKWMHEDCLKG